MPPNVVAPNMSSLSQRELSPRAPDSTSANTRDRQWVDRIHAGDSRAFDEMVVAYYESLLRLALSYVRSRDLAEEVVQDVFLAIWQQRTSWSPNRALRVYLYAATRNRAFSQLRHRVVEER